MVKDVPSNYVFYLVCCLKPECCHPVCKSQSMSQLPTWYAGGPVISYLPLPIPDPARPWDGSNCKQCQSDCHGHYLKPAESLQSTSPQMVCPPSIILKEAFQNLRHYTASEAEIEEIAKQALLTRQETKMWFEHLHTIRENRKRGSLRTAATRRQKKVQKEKETRESSYYCAACSTPYQEFSNAVSYVIPGTILCWN